MLKTTFNYYVAHVMHKPPHLVGGNNDGKPNDEKLSRSVLQWQVEGQPSA